ncbi:unnamed protein product [Pieris macdunnoughi]|uniref:Uncharacterized protein n=1 Tax=Pieris macdunnoughi TaxID=345717 RepID=A0A821VXE6_9NEOP|nr:unnamed protein product [Pieris macdunnoughi]
MFIALFATVYLLAISIEARVIKIDGIPLTSQEVIIKIDLNNESNPTARVRIIEREPTNMEAGFKKVVPTLENRNFIGDNKCPENYKKIGPKCVEIKKPKS